MTNIRFFRTFLEVARHGSFAAASEYVSLSPAAVGLQMRALEEELGETLFDRNGKAVLLSASAHRLKPHVEQLLQLYDELRTRTSNANELVGSISVGAISTSTGALARGMLKLRTTHPKLTVVPFIGYSGSLAARVRDKEFDAAVAVKDSFGESSGTLWTPLYQEPFVFIANRQAAMSESPASLLRDHLFLRVERNSDTGAKIDALMRRERLESQNFLDISSIRTIVELVQQNVGVAIVPLLHASDWEADHRLRIIRFQDPAAHRTIGLLENESRSYLTSALRHAMM